MATVLNRSRPKLVSLALGFLLLATCAAGIGVYGYTKLRWGCPSTEEANRPRDPDEVATAFAGRGLPLAERRRDDVNSTLYLRRSGDAALFVRVCERGCSGPEQLPPRGHAAVRQGVRFGNVVAWIAAPKVASANALRRRVGPAVDDLTPGSDTRCFPS